MRVRLCMLAAILCLLWLPTPSPAQEVNRVVAVVGDEVITSLDVEKVERQLQEQVAAAAAARPGEPLPSATQVRRMALDRLIEDKIFAQEVKRNRLAVSQTEIDSYIDRIKASNQLSQEEFVAQLSRRGITLEEYQEDLKREILKHKLVDRNIKSRVVVSDKEVEDFYRQQEGKSGQAGQVRLRAVFLRVDDKAGPAQEEQVRKLASELEAKVAGGANFAEVARRYSQGPGAEQGGDLGLVSPGDLLPQMREALAKLKPGQVSQVFKVPGSYVFMKLEDQAAASAVSGLTPQLREQIREKLEMEAMEKRFREWLRDLRAKAYVKVME
ncbi:MAG: SurA N-terminal domain-containing protein [Pseudomonadota bacterium]